MFHFKPHTVSAALFRCLTSGNLHELCEKCEKDDFRPFLPSLLRMTLLPSIFSEFDQNDLRSRLLACDKGNFIVSLMRCDFTSLETELRKELKIRRKNLSSGSKFDGQSTAGLSIRFENGSAEEKFRILLIELLSVNLLLTDGNKPLNGLRKFEPMDNCLMFDDCCHLLCVACAEMKNFMELENICEVLLRYKYGPYVIQRLAANFGDRFDQLFVKLIQNGDSIEEDNFVSRKRAETLELLVALNPAAGVQLIQSCIMYRKLPSTFINYSLKLIDSIDFVSILAGILIGNDTLQRLWFVHFFQNGQKSRPNSITALAFGNLKLFLRKEIRNDAQTSYDLHHRTSLLKLFCSLRSFCGLRLTDDDNKLLFEYVFTVPEPSILSTKFILTGLCYLVAFTASTPNNAEHEAAVTAWLRKLVDLEPEFLLCGESYGEMLLLLAINFHSNQISALSQLVSNVLRMKIQLKSNQLIRLRTIFTQDLFPEQIVAERASKIAVTKNLNANCQGHLPIHCVQQLLTSRTFAKYKICIKDWIIAQLIECTAPVHPAVITLLEAYCASCVLPLTKSGQHHASVANASIEELEILHHFCDDVFDRKRLTFRILLMYYVLLHEELVLSNIRAIAAVGRSVQNLETVFDSIPVFYLFNYVENNLTDYQIVYGPLMRLVTNRFPYLFSSNFIRKAPKRMANEKLILSAEELHKALKNCRLSPSKAMRILKKSIVLAAPNSNLNELIEALCSSLPDLLDAYASKEIMNLVASLWTEYEGFLPRKLYISTVIGLLPKNFAIKNFSHNDLCDDPLMVLRVDERIFSCPILLKLLLRILHCYLNASRVRLSRQLQYAGAATSKRPVYNPQLAMLDAERDELMRALIGAQESAAVQILLETCLSATNVRDGSNLNLEDVRSIICSHLHQMFIADPMLSKLVHFQGYPRELIPIAVKGVPSLHICLDFIPEMLGQPDHSKRVFAIELLSFLCEQYSIPKAYNCAKLAVNVVSTLVSVLPGSEIVSIFEPVVSALVRICRYFPPLSNDVVSLLVQVGRICVARLGAKGFAACASTSGYCSRWTVDGDDAELSSFDKSPEKKLLNSLHKAFAFDFHESVLNCKF